MGSLEENAMTALDSFATESTFVDSKGTGTTEKVTTRENDGFN